MHHDIARLTRHYLRPPFKADDDIVQSTTVTNALPVPIMLSYVSTTAGLITNVAIILPGTTFTVSTAPVNVAEALVTLVGSNALITAYLLATFWPATPVATALTVSSSNLVAPFNIPPPPTKPAASGIAPNPRPVVVGVGSMPLSTPFGVVREQYWTRLENSVSVAPNESKECFYSLTTGVSKSQSSTKSIDASASLSASGGWGPFSASVSASLSLSSSTTQSVEMQEERTTTITETYAGQVLATGSTAPPVTTVYVTWQLMERISFFVPAPVNPDPATSSAEETLAYAQALGDYAMQLVCGNITRAGYVQGNSPTLTLSYTIPLAST